MSHHEGGKIVRPVRVTVRGQKIEDLSEKQLNMMMCGALMSIRSFMDCPMKSLKWEEALDRATNHAMEITKEVRRRAEANE